METYRVKTSEDETVGSIELNWVINHPEVLIPDRPIAFNRDLVRIGIGVTGALFLSQALYWTKRTREIDGWFYKTISDWEEETGLSEREQRTIKKTLQDKNLIIIEKRGLPARNYFKVNTEKLIKMLVQANRKSCQNDSTSPVETTALDPSKRQHPLIQRVHTETTTDIISSELGSQVKEIMQVFYEINPTLNWGNKTTRKACENMIAKFGFEGTIGMAKQIVSVHGKAYAPVATTPYEMMMKLSKFKAYFDAEKDKLSKNKFSNVPSI